MAQADNTKVLLWVGGGVAAWLLVLKPIMSAIGVDPADTQAVTDAANVPATESPFSPAYTPLTDGYGGISYLNTLFAQAKQQYDNNPDDPALNNTIFGKAAKWGEGIISAYGFWHIDPDTNAVIAIMAQPQTKQEVAALASYLNVNYQKDLLHYLKYGPSLILPSIPYGLSDKEMAVIINQINNLPDGD